MLIPRHGLWTDTGWAPWATELKSVAHRSASARFAGVGHVPLLTVLPFGDSEFVGLAASLRALPIRFLFGSVSLWLCRAARLFLRTVIGRSMSMSHVSRWNRKRHIATHAGRINCGRAALLAGPSES